MKPIFAAVLACTLGLAIVPQAWLTAACAQENQPEEKPDQGESAQRALYSKVDAYIGCLNSLSGDVYRSRNRYFSWASRSGPTGREFINYGLYSIDNPSGCREAVEMVNDVVPHYEELETVANTFVGIASRLYPLIKEAERYYDQSNYKDDNMARGKAMHPLLVAGFDEFAATDRKLRKLVDAVNNARAQQNLAAIERQEGRTIRYHSAALLVHAKELADTMTGPRDIAKISAALTEYENSITTLEELVRRSDDDGQSTASTVLSSSRSFLRAATAFMRRVRDKIPYNMAERANLGFAGGISDWMVEGSPANLAQNYNALIDAFNRRTISPLLKWVPAAS